MWTAKRFNIVSKIRLWIAMPLAVVIIAMICFGIYAGIQKDITKGVNVGVDFAGGTIVTVNLGQDNLTGEKYTENYEKIKEVILSEEIANTVLEKAKTYKDSEGNLIFSSDLSIQGVTPSISYVQKSGTGEEMAIVFKIDNVSKTYDKDNQLTTLRKDYIENALKDIYSDDNGFDGVEVGTSMIGATASSNLIKTAILSVLVTLILILIYIIIRFEVWSGFSAIIALTHDITMMFCLTVIFRIQINSAFIAAMITIVSYSINNTIVVFDRVKENMKNEKGLQKATFVNNKVVVEGALWDTFLRSLNTTITTMIAIVIFAILGASSIREFALPVIFGLIAGFFSSLCLAPSLYCAMKDASDNKKKDKNNKSTTKSKQKYAGV